MRDWVDNFPLNGFHLSLSHSHIHIHSFSLTHTPYMYHCLPEFSMFTNMSIHLLEIYEKQIEKFTKLHNRLKNILDSTINSSSNRNFVFFEKFTYYQFFLHNQAMIDSSNDSLHFLMFAPINDLISKFADEEFRYSLKSLSNIMYSICKSEKNGILQFKNQDKYVFQFIASRTAIIIYLCLQYSHLLPPYVYGPDLCDFIVIEEYFDRIPCELLEHYLKQIAVNYMDRKDYTYLISLFNCIDKKNYYAAVAYQKIYEFVPWFPTAIGYENLLNDFLGWIIPYKIAVNVLKKINFNMVSNDNWQNFINLGITYGYGVKLMIEVFKQVTVQTRNSIITNFIKSKTISQVIIGRKTPLFLAAFRIPGISLVEDVKINWLIHNMLICRTFNSDNKWISSSNVSGVPMHTMPPLFGSTIIPDDLIVSLGRYLRGQHDLISNILLYILMPHNKSFVFDAKFVTLCYVREILWIENVVNQEKQTNHKKRTNKVQFFKFEISNTNRQKNVTNNPMNFTDWNYFLSTYQPVLNIPFVPWQIASYNNMNGFLATDE